MTYAAGAMFWAVVVLTGLVLGTVILYTTVKLAAYAWHAGKGKYEDDQLNRRDEWRTRNGNASGGSTRWRPPRSS